MTKMRKLLSSAIILALAFSASWGQSLTEAAKKEKERRAAYKDKPTVVLTNDTLLRMTKKEAVSTSQPSGAEAEPAEEEPAAAEPAPTYQTGPVPTIVPQSSTVQATPMAGQSENALTEGATGTLESRWQKAKEYADLLELKLNALWQQFYNMNTMTTRDKIQQDISETYEKYTQARQEEEKALADLQKQKGRQD